MATQESLNMKSLCKMLGASATMGARPSAAAPPSSSSQRRLSVGAAVLAVVDWLQKALHAAAALALGLAAVGVVVAALVSLLFGTRQDEQVVSSTPAGVLRSVTLGGGLLTKVLVETDTAFYVVDTAVSLGKDESLQLQRRASGARYLCNAAGHCARLVAAP